MEREGNMPFGEGGGGANRYFPSGGAGTDGIRDEGWRSASVRGGGGVLPEGSE